MNENCYFSVIYSTNKTRYSPLLKTGRNGVTFRFIVKFFPPDPGQLQRELTRCHTHTHTHYMTQHNTTQQTVIIFWSPAGICSHCRSNRICPMAVWPVTITVLLYWFPIFCRVCRVSPVACLWYVWVCVSEIMPVCFCSRDRGLCRRAGQAAFGKQEVHPKPGVPPQKDHTLP